MPYNIYHFHGNHRNASIVFFRFSFIVRLVLILSKETSFLASVSGSTHVLFTSLTTLEKAVVWYMQVSSAEAAFLIPVVFLRFCTHHFHLLLICLTNNQLRNRAIVCRNYSLKLFVLLPWICQYDLSAIHSFFFKVRNMMSSTFLLINQAINTICQFNDWLPTLHLHMLRHWELWVYCDLWNCLIGGF